MIPGKPNKTQFVLFCTALLLPFANSAHADGAYQRTKDGKTLIWNNHPLPGDVAEWSGGRDAEGYAVGRGTLTWFRTAHKIVTGSNIPLAKLETESRYTGEMLRGKFDGLVVNVDATGKTFHGTFVDGRKSKGTSGPAPAGALAASDQRREEKVRAEVVEEKEPLAPAAGPSAIPAKKIEQPVVAETAIKTQTPAPEMDDSLQSLVGAPPVIPKQEKVAVEPAPAPPAPARSTSSPPSVGPKLTASEVIELANAEAQKRGYNPAEYQKPLADYHAEDESWSVVYDQKNAYGIGKHFSVSVEDKSKKADLSR